MIMDDNGGQMIFGDLVGLKLPDICLTGEEKPHPGILSRPGIEPGSAAWQVRMLAPPTITWSVTPPTSLSQRNKQYFEGSIEVVDWLTSYQMPLVTLNIFIYEIIGVSPPLNG